MPLGHRHPEDPIAARIRFSPDGLLYVVPGGASDADEAQDLTSLLSVL